MATLTSPTKDELIASVRRTLGQEDENNSSWSNKELGEYLDEAVRRYFAEVIQYSEGQFTTSTTLDLVAGQREVNCPSDFFEVVRLYKVLDDGRRQILSYDNSFNRSYTTNTSNNSTNYAPSYKLRRNQIVLETQPAFSQTGAWRSSILPFRLQWLTGGTHLLVTFPLSLKILL